MNDEDNTSNKNEFIARHHRGLKPLTRIGACLVLIVLAIMYDGKTAIAIGGSNEGGCIVKNVNWNDDGKYRFMNIVCTSGNVYWAFQSNPDTGCSGSIAIVALDSIKIYQSLATAARLSGRPVMMWYNTVSACWGGVRAISSIELKD